MSLPFGVAADALGNVYIADTYNNSVKKWVATNNTVTTIAASGLSLPFGVAVDAAGNVLHRRHSEQCDKEVDDCR